MPWGKLYFRICAYATRVAWVAGAKERLVVCLCHVSKGPGFKRAQEVLDEQGISPDTSSYGFYLRLLYSELLILCQGELSGREVAGKKDSHASSKVCKEGSGTGPPHVPAVTQTLWGCDGKATHSGSVPQTHTELHGPQQPSLASLLRDSRF